MLIEETGEFLSSLRGLDGGGRESVVRIQVTVLREVRTGVPEVRQEGVVLEVLAEVDLADSEIAHGLADPLVRFLCGPEEDTKN